MQARAERRKWKMRAAAGLLLMTSGGQVSALSLTEVKYALHKDPQAKVEADLHALARRGDSGAMLYLADRLARNATAESAREAITLYQRVFNGGNGQITALASWVNVADRSSTLRNSQSAAVKEALRAFPLARDMDTVGTSLEVSLVYPELFSSEKLKSLLDLYKRACVENCRTDTYNARYLERAGLHDQADQAYRKAIPTDAQAVRFYFAFLGEKQAETFKAYAESVRDNAVVWPVEVVTAIGSILTGLTEKNDGNATHWLDAAMKRGSVNAMISKADYMMSFPDDFGPEETLALIKQVEQTQPLQGRSLRAYALMVKNWRILDPQQAHEILKGLIQDGYNDAHMGLGALYSMGGLDEADQDAAIQSYKTLATQGDAEAFYRIAMIYEAGRSICQDKVKAYAYAQIALDLGRANARLLLNRIEEKISADEKASAMQAREDIFTELSFKP